MDLKQVIELIVTLVVAILGVSAITIKLKQKNKNIKNNQKIKGDNNNVAGRDIVINNGGDKHANK
jgi:cbb3-type cytochrome oxidase cytochrome c subunit